MYGGPLASINKVNLLFVMFDPIHALKLCLILLKKMNCPVQIWDFGNNILSLSCRNAYYFHNSF